MNTTDHDDVIRLIAQGYTFCPVCGQLSPNLICPDCQNSRTQEELDALWKEWCEIQRKDERIEPW